MVERELYAGLIDGAKQSGWLLCRISDGSWGKKPFDIFGLTPSGRGVGIEVKLKKRENWVSQLEAHQIAWLKEYYNHGGLALVPIFDEKNKEMRVYYITNFENILNSEFFTLRRKNSLWVGWPTNW